MKDIFANMYEWWGFLPLYSNDLAEHLRGYDLTCSDYFATPWYTYIGWSMIAVVAVLYALQYHIVDSTRFMRRHHWWIVVLIISILNFSIAFSLPYNSVQSGDYCNQLNISFSDCAGFGLSNVIWGFVIFLVITTIPWLRKLSTNCRHTTFYKP